MRIRFRFLYTLSVFSALGSATGCNRDAAGTVAPGGYVPAESVAEALPQRPAPVFSREVAPLFDQYCLRCHDGATAEGGVALDELSDGIPDAQHRPLLVRVADNLRSEYMPPAGEPRPSGLEFETINFWLDTVLSDDKVAERRVSIRRLNRAEYNNTIRDLIGLDLRPADEFPFDDVGYGFDNIGDVLSTSPVLLEMYLAAAEKVIANAFASDIVRERLLNPPTNTVPLVFRRYTPPIRSPVGDKTLRPVLAAPDPELARQQHIYNVLLAFCDRAFRRPATHDEVTRLVGVVLSAEKDGEPSESALQLALRAVLMSPHFLFLKDTLDQDLSSTGRPVPDNDFALASRISYFLWRSMPDEPLFQLAQQGTLRRPEILRAQVQRMLQDPKGRALAENFASQWLETRRLAELTPDPTLFPEFDDSLRTAMGTETELFFEAIRQGDRSVLDFIDADYTFVNERLARHYDLPGITGSHFRRVSLTGSSRGGVLTQASVLAATSNPNRTSPVKRGKWILENILGTPPSPPPSGVEALKEGKDHAQAGTIRRRMEQHRTDPTCASCHRRMDPLGFGLENFNAIGGWRENDEGQPVDSSGRLPSGPAFRGASELKAALMTRRKAFVRCLAEKMLTYALGRGLDRADRRAVDQVVATLERNQYRFSALVIASVESDPFLNPCGKKGNR